MPSKIIFQGAEAVILKQDNKIIKDRIKKNYRLTVLDEKIRKQRTKAEAKLLHKASKIINAPVPEDCKEKNKIIMPFIDGKKLSEHLDNFSLKKQKQICREIGKSIAKLHENHIIHGDLTTSNMILVEDNTCNFEKHLCELKKLKLPKKQYAIFGSGPLAIRGIRKSEDIDIIVNQTLWNKLVKKYPLNTEFLIKINSIEIYKNWLPWIKDTDKIIEDSETIEGFPFVKLKHVFDWKRKYGREKDKKDIELIKQYRSLKDNKIEPIIIYFIDFGLGYISQKYEDKAVDLHLLKQALEAKHYKNWEVLIKEVFKKYEKYNPEAKIIFERLKAVEKRGRYKH